MLVRDQVTALTIRTVDTNNWYKVRQNQVIRQFGELNNFALVEVSTWLDTDTRDLTFFLYDPGNEIVYEVSDESFYKLLSWKLAGDDQLLHEYLVVWTNLAENEWKIVQIPTIFNGYKY